MKEIENGRNDFLFLVVKDFLKTDVQLALYGRYSHKK